MMYKVIVGSHVSGNQLTGVEIEASSPEEAGKKSVEFVRKHKNDVCWKYDISTSRPHLKVFSVEATGEEQTTASETAPAAPPIDETFNVGDVVPAEVPSEEIAV